MRRDSEFKDYLNSLQISDEAKQILILNRLEILMSRFRRDIDKITSEINEFKILVQAVESTIVYFGDNIECTNAGLLKSEIEKQKK